MGEMEEKTTEKGDNRWVDLWTSTDKEKCEMNPGSWSILIKTELWSMNFWFMTSYSQPSKKRENFVIDYWE